VIEVASSASSSVVSSRLDSNDDKTVERLCWFSARVGLAEVLSHLLEHRQSSNTAVVNAEA
jgi:hypothetical protein